MASFLFCTSLFAQDAVNEEKGILQFETPILDYGTIAHNADGVRSFKFKNVGNAPIVITSVKGSCGCTVPAWPKEPVTIKPGESKSIDVTFKYNTDSKGNLLLNYLNSSMGDNDIFNCIKNTLN